MVRAYVRFRLPNGQTTELGHGDLIGRFWCLTLNGATRPLQVGDSWEIDGRRFCAVGLSLDNAGRTVTRLEGGVSRPVRIVAHFDSVHIHCEGETTIALSGLAARLVSEMVAFDGPVSWEVLARGDCVEDRT